ncbi:MAG: cupredoxin family copper-binding protein [Acidimicrobiia bacterium]
MRRLLVPIALTLAVAVGACGDDSTSSTAATTVAVTSAGASSSAAGSSSTSTTAAATTAATTTIAPAATASPATTAVPAPAAPASAAPATRPPATQPPATQPPATQPPVTQPPVTQPSGGSASVSIQSFAFSPNPITVKAGTTITVTNKDAAPHTFTADGGAWTSPSLGPNGTYSRVFNDVGTFAFHCDVHPAMKGTLVVN